MAIEEGIGSSSIDGNSISGSRVVITKALNVSIGNYGYVGAFSTSETVGPARTRSFGILGNDVNLTYKQKGPVGPYSLMSTISGLSISGSLHTLSAYNLSIIPGGYQYIGDNSLSEEVGPVQAGNFALLGISINLVYQPRISNNYLLLTASGSFAPIGIPVNLVYHQRVSKNYTLLTASRLFNLRSIASTLLAYAPRHGNPHR